MKKENQPGNYQLKADLEGNYLIDKDHKATKRLGIFYAPREAAFIKWPV